MLRCWNADQDSRPDFTSLADVLGDFLETTTRQVTFAVVCSYTTISWKLFTGLKKCPTAILVLVAA